MLEAVILAGGLGTRLRSVVSHLPKPMADIGGKPFLARLIEHLSSQGVGHIVLAVGYKAAVVIDFFGNEYSGCKISYSEEKDLLGTGGGLLKASKHLYCGQNFLVFNGDTIFPIDIMSLMRSHETSDALVTIGSFSATENSRYGKITLKENGDLSSFGDDYADIGEPANGGVYVFNSKALEIKHSMGATFSLEADFVPFLLTKHCRIKHVCFDEPFLDMGLPRDYKKLQQNFDEIFCLNPNGT